KLDGIVKKLRNAKQPIVESPLFLVHVIFRVLPSEFDGLVGNFLLKNESKLSLDYVREQIEAEDRRISNRKEEELRLNNIKSINKSKPYQTKELDASNITCYFCGEIGHKAKVCPKKKNEDVTADVGINSRRFHCNNIDLHVSVLGSNVRRDNHQWMVDSGANAHFCNNRNMLSNVEQCDVLVQM
ncbi:unnamed protein product, partial [Ectocarpus sp. 12 AP-2014]